jgi:hypothetical protein
MEGCLNGFRDSHKSLCVEVMGATAPVQTLLTEAVITA